MAGAAYAVYGGSEKVAAGENLSGLFLEILQHTPSKIRYKPGRYSSHTYAYLQLWCISRAQCDPSTNAELERELSVSGRTGRWCPGREGHMKEKIRSGDCSGWTDGRGGGAKRTEVAGGWCEEAGRRIESETGRARGVKER